MSKSLEEKINDVSEGKSDELDLRNLGLRKIPEKVYTLTELKKIILGTSNGGQKFLNTIRFISPKIANLINLEILILDGSFISEFPCEIYELSKLKVLSLEGNIMLKKLPPGLSNLENIETLNFRYTSLNELPVEIFTLKKIKNIIYSPHEKSTLYQGFKELKTLKHLHLSNMIYENTSESFLPIQLEELSLKSTSKEAIQNLHLLKDLKVLNLEQIPISEIEFIPKLENLEKLILHNVGMNSIPDGIGNLKNLKILDVRYNPISSISTEISNLGSLEELQLASSSLERFEKIPTPILKLKKLKRLTLYGINLKSITPKLANLKELKFLSISSSEFKSIPEAITRLKKLEYLDLRACSIKSIPLKITELKKLKTLMLPHNNITFLESPLFDFAIF